MISEEDRRRYLEKAKQVQKLLQEKGREALELAKRELLSEKIYAPRARKALEEFLEKRPDYVRPALMTLACEAVGGNPELVKPVAAAMILAGGAFDLHDDIIDKDYYKRDQPRKKSFLGRYGDSLVLLLGDALIIKGISLLHTLYHLEIPKPTARIIINLTVNYLYQLGSAEALELNHLGDLNLTPEKYLRIIYLKAADVEAYTRIGAILGKANKQQEETLAHYGRTLGKIAILRDDLEDTLNPRELTRRIQNETPPLPILHLIHTKKNHQLHQKLQRLQANPSTKTAKQIIEKIKQEAISHVLNLMHHEVEGAKQKLRESYWKNAAAVQALKDILDVLVPSFKEDTIHG